MGANNFTRTCIDCGLVMENCGASRKRCPECVKIYSRIRSANAKRASRERARLGIVIPKVTHTDSSKYCKGCIYYAGEFDNTKMCNYIFITGHRRPCPPGKGCTVKVKRPRKS